MGETVVPNILLIMHYITFKLNGSGEERSIYYWNKSLRYFLLISGKNVSEVKRGKHTVRYIKVEMTPIIAFHFRFRYYVLAKPCAMFDYHNVVTVFCDCAAA